MLILTVSDAFETIADDFRFALIHLAPSGFTTLSRRSMGAFAVSPDS